MADGLRVDIPLSANRMRRGREVLEALARVLLQRCNITVDLEAPDVEGFPDRAAQREGVEADLPYWTLRWTGRRSKMNSFGHASEYGREKTYTCELTAYLPVTDYSVQHGEFGEWLEQAADWIESVRKFDGAVLDTEAPEVVGNTVRRQGSGDTAFRYHVGTLRFAVKIEDRIHRTKEIE